MTDIDEVRRKSEASDPCAPWNVKDAEFCDKHPDVEMESDEYEDCDSPTGWSTHESCPVCEALAHLDDGQLYCEDCYKSDLEYDPGEGFYCLNCEEYAEGVNTYGVVKK